MSRTPRIRRLTRRVGDIQVSRLIIFIRGDAIFYPAPWTPFELCFARPLDARDGSVSPRGHRSRHCPHNLRECTVNISDGSKN